MNEQEYQEAREAEQSWALPDDPDDLIIVPLDEASMEDYPEGFADDPTSPGYVPEEHMEGLV